MKKLLIIILSLLLYGCKQQATLFTRVEKELINNADVTQPMRILKIDNYNDSIFLRQTCVDVNIENDKEDLQNLVKRMRVTMASDGGVGIAANQVGIGRNVLLISRYDKQGAPVEVFINPQIVTYSKEIVNFIGDGCLSVPGYRGITKRYESVKVKYYNEQGELIEELIKGFYPPNFTTIIFQHEFDHLKGTLFLDRIHDNKLYINKSLE